MDPVTVLNNPPPPPAAPIVPQTPAAAPAAPAAPAAAPAGPPPTVAALSPDTLVDIGGGARMKMSDVVAGYQAAVEVGLNDADNRVFLQTVYRATQGDEAALQQLAAIRANPPAPAASGATPTPAAPAAAGAAAIPKASEFATVMQKMLEPIARRVDEMYGVHTVTVREKEIGALKNFFQTKKEEFPNCSEIEAAATRVYDRWDTLKKSNPKASSADLDRIMREEESYLGAARPKAAAPQATEVIRMDAPATRIPGLTPPGRLPLPPGQPTNTAPAQMPVSTNVPSAGSPSGAPGQTPNANQPMTMESLAADIERQVNGMGIRTR